MALTESQKRKARETPARKRGVSTSSISDSDLIMAITNNIITTSMIASFDTGSSYSCDTSSSFSSFDGGSSCF